jgi:branched-chain amino acid transport system ATP-binding protein
MLRVQNISVFYGSIRALHDVSLEINPGELVALIGANGSGKSSTLNAISGLVPCQTGTIEFNGTRINGRPPAEIVRLGISQCLERRRIFPAMTVLENLELGGYIRKNQVEVKKSIGEIFAQFPILKEREHQLAGTLSGGEQQMLSIGRALMSNPSLFLIDEPSLGLAPLMVEKLFGIIQEIRRQGTTIVLVEQNAHAALEIADRGYVLETGRIVLADTGKDLLHNAHVKAAYLGA